MSSPNLEEGGRKIATATRGNSRSQPGTRSAAYRLRSVDFRTPLLFLALLALFLGSWEVSVRSGLASRMVPPPTEVFSSLVTALSNPFYSYGVNDAGIGLQLAASLWRVLVGFVLAAVLALPLGFAIGMSPVLSRAVDPFVQVLRPVSPLAWLPIGLAVFEDSERTAIFVIFISALWPVLLNTIAASRSVPRGYLEVARTLQAGRWTTIRQVILPAALPEILTGLRISMGIAWLVIVAAEMLVGGRGIGYFIWNEWNNLNIANIMVGILLVGVVGLCLDKIFRFFERRWSYEG